MRHGKQLPERNVLPGRTLIRRQLLLSQERSGQVLGGSSVTQGREVSLTGNHPCWLQAHCSRASAGFQDADTVGICPLPEAVPWDFYPFSVVSPVTSSSCQESHGPVSSLLVWEAAAKLRGRAERRAKPTSASQLRACWDKCLELLPS